MNPDRGPSCASAPSRNRAKPAHPDHPLAGLQEAHPGAPSGEVRHGREREIEKVEARDPEPAVPCGQLGVLGPSGARDGQPGNAAAEKGTRDDVEQVMLFHSRVEKAIRNASANMKRPTRRSNERATLPT